MQGMFKKKYLLIFFLFFLSSFFLLKYKNNFHIYYTIKNIISSDKEYRLLKKNNFNSDLEYLNYNNNNADFRANWRFRPEHFHPIYPKILAADVNHDGIKELYLASQTKKVYELNSLNGKIQRTWDYPIGQASSKGTLLYKIKNEHYLLTTSTISLPIKVYSLNLSQPKININWSNNLHGQFVEGGINMDGDRIIIGTRDAPYSRGSLYLFNKEGEIKFGPEKTIDICNSKPIISDNFFIHGSHKFYNSQHANSIVKRNIINGQILWKNNIGFDTGYQTSNLFHYNNDSHEDIAVYKNDPRTTFILDGKNGEIIDQKDGILLEFIDKKILAFEKINKNINNKIYNLPNKKKILKNRKNLKKFLSSANNNYERTYLLKNLFNDSFQNKDILIKKISLNYIDNKNTIKEIYFLDNKHNTASENFFLTYNDKEVLINIFNVFANYIIYQRYDFNGNLLKIEIENIAFNASDNNFNNNFYKNSESIPSPNIYISKISDLDNDKKLEVLLGVENNIISFNLDLLLNINYDFKSYPNIKNDNLIFNTN